MDIELLSKMVSDLILEQDEVGLPGLGAFVAEIVPASFSDKGYTINPPYRRITFRTTSSADDSLARAYASSNSVELEHAKSVIRNFLASLASELRSAKSVDFPGLGRLKATKDNVFFFVCDEDFNLFPDGFGLEPVSLKTRSRSALAPVAKKAQLPAMPEMIPMEDAPIIVETVPEEEPEPPTQASPTQTEVPATRAPRKRHAWPWVLAALSVIVAALLVGGRHMAKYYPDLVDSLLYTEEELQIVKQL